MTLSPCSEYTVDPATRQLQQVNEGNVIGTTNPEGLCMYDSPNGTVYVTTLKREGSVLRQFRIPTRTATA